LHSEEKKPNLEKCCVFTVFPFDSQIAMVKKSFHRKRIIRLQHQVTMTYQQKWSRQSTHNMLHS